MNNIIQKINHFFKSINYKKPSITYLNSDEQTKYNIEEIFDIIDLLPKITEIFKKYHGTSKEDKIDINIITKTDLEITEIVNKFIIEKYPNDIIISEEKETTLKQNPNGIIIFDPLDGTKSFLEGKNNCCFAFSRLKIDNRFLNKGYSIIWEPFSMVLTIGISGFGVFVCGRKITENHNDKIIASVNSFKSETKSVEYGKIILEKAFDNIEYSFSGSGSVEASKLITNRTSIIIREKQKLWDFIPGGFIAHIAKKQVFYHNTNEDIFPIKIDKILDILQEATTKSERKIKYITITLTKNQRKKIFNTYIKNHI